MSVSTLRKSETMIYRMGRPAHRPNKVAGSSPYRYIFMYYAAEAGRSFSTGSLKVGRVHNSKEKQCN